MPKPKKRRKQKGHITTLTDVARELGVSAMTVSRVINDGPASPEVKRRVRAAINRLDYQPNEAARLLKGTRSRTLGLIVPDVRDYFFGTIFQSVQAAARAHDLTTLFLTHDHDLNRERQVLELMLERSVAGLLVVPAGGDTSHWKRVIDSGVIVVSLDRPLPGLKADSVQVDNQAASYEAVLHLVDHGHRRIACLGTESELFTMGARLAGYVAAMQARGLPLLPYVSREALPAAKIRELFAQAWKVKPSESPTAVFSLNNACTLQALAVIQQLDLRIPSDVAYVGFDDFQFASLVWPHLTAVRQPAEEIGRRGVELLMGRIEDASRLTATTILPTSLIIRNSCGCSSAETQSSGAAKFAETRPMASSGFAAETT